MKDDTKICEERDIGGTNIIPISSLAFGVGIFFLHPYIIPGPFYYPRNRVVIAKIIKKTETRIEIVYSLT